MKKLIIVFMILAIATFSYAGKESITPSALLLNSDKVELMSAEFIWGAAAVDNICRITYRVWNSDRTNIIREISFDISGADFTALVSGYGSTMETRLETDLWQDIQSKFSLVP